MIKKQCFIAFIIVLSCSIFANPKISYGSFYNVTNIKESSKNQVRQVINIQQVIVVDENRFQLVGQGDFNGKTIQIISQNGEILLATYNPSEQIFITQNGKKVVPGIQYEVKADWARIPRKQAIFVIPNLLVAKQVDSNKIELLYDRPVNLQTATKANSYWVRNNLNQPADIASISKNDPVAINNALTPNRVKITPIDNTRTRFLMTFNVNATPGVQYTVIPCFITTPDRSGYMGGNYSSSSKNTFIAR